MVASFSYFEQHSNLRNELLQSVTYNIPNGLKLTIDLPYLKNFGDRFAKEIKISYYCGNHVDSKVGIPFLVIMIKK